MKFFCTQNLFLIIILSLIDSFSKCQEESKDPGEKTDEEWLKADNLAVNYVAQFDANDEMNTEIIELKFPFYSQNVTNLDPKFMKVVKKYCRKSLNDIMDTLEVRFEASQSKSWLPGKGKLVAAKDWAGLTATLAANACNQWRDSRKLKDKKVGTNNKFNGEMAHFFSRMLDKSEIELLKLENGAKVSKAEFKKELFGFLSHLIEAIESSNVGPYFKWSKGAMNGENFEQFGARIMGKARYFGVGGALGPLNNMFKVILRLSS